jgi:hypothetical protein
MHGEIMISTTYVSLGGNPTIEIGDPLSLNIAVIPLVEFRLNWGRTYDGCAHE